MRHEDDFIEEWKTKRIDRSRPPLRWIANLAGTIATSSILKVSYLEEDAYEGWRYKVNLFLWDTFWPIYNKYGTIYEVETEDEDF